MDQSRQLIKLALFGRPIAASLSPKIHRLFAAQFDLDIEFQRIETGAEGFVEALETFQLAGGFGCNVTLPLKRDAWQLAADASLEVSQAQAANTLIRQSSGDWFAHNTDGPGLVTDLSVNHDIDLAGKRVLILGAGGAAAGIIGSLLVGGVKHLVLVNRNQQRAAELAKRFNDVGDVLVTDWESLSGQGSFDLLINATSLGHQGKVPALVDTLFGSGSCLYDLNYFKASLPLKEWCEARGLTYIDGLGMLVEQAARSFYIWTGLNADTAAVIEACRVDINVHPTPLA